MTTTLSVQAKVLLNENDLGGFTVPTKGLYPYQWNWDSAFSALGFAEFDYLRAWREIETLLDAQWECGFVPHVVFRKDDPSYFPGPSVWQGRGPIMSTGISNPPIASTVVKSLIERSDDFAKPKAKELFPKLLKWHRWFKEIRDFNGKGVVVTVHPWESGRDNSPEWDKPASTIDISHIGDYQRRDTQLVDAQMRPHKIEYDRYLALIEHGVSTNWDHKKIAQEGPFRVVDVGMTMVLLRANRDLLEIAKFLGEASAVTEIEQWIKDSEVGVEWLWNSDVGCYCSRDTVTGESSAMLTNASFLSFFAGVGSDKQKASMITHIEAIDSNCQYLIPSFDPHDSKFDHVRYWRGPVWLVMNYMISNGLSECGYSDWAERIRIDSQKLVKKSGFYESFSALTGEGTGGSNFSWTASMWLAWAAGESSSSEQV